MSISLLASKYHADHQQRGLICFLAAYPDEAPFIFTWVKRATMIYSASRPSGDYVLPSQANEGRRGGGEMHSA